MGHAHFRDTSCSDDVRCWESTENRVRTDVELTIYHLEVKPNWRRKRWWIVRRSKSPSWAQLEGSRRHTQHRPVRPLFAKSIFRNGRIRWRGSRSSPTSKTLMAWWAVTPLRRAVKKKWKNMALSFAWKLLQVLEGPAQPYCRSSELGRQTTRCSSK